MKRSLVLLVLALVLVVAGAAAQKKKEKRPDVKLSDAPARVHSWQNPYEGNSEAVQAGRKLFLRHCSKCHGDDARGDGEDAPDLHAPEMEKASNGALFWFLTNGSLRGGMPAWSKLPDQQRWQLVSYLKTLAPPEKQRE